MKGAAAGDALELLFVEFGQRLQGDVGVLHVALMHVNLHAFRQFKAEFAAE